jgi:hypothetical protein
MMRIIFTAVFLLITTAWLIYTLRSKGVGLTGRVRKYVIVWGTVQVILLGLTLYAIWPMLPPVLSQREVTAEQFMTAVAAGQSERAMTMVINSTETDVAELRTNLANPANQPLSWELRSPNRRHILVGTAVFPDSQSKDVVLHLTWEWPRARWAITGAEFGNEIGQGNVRSWLYTEFIPLSWIISWVQIASVIGLFLVWRTIREEKLAYRLSTDRY